MSQTITETTWDCLVCGCENATNEDGTTEPCRECGAPNYDAMGHTAQEAALLAKHDEGEDLHAFRASGEKCGWCGDAVAREGDTLVGSDGSTNCPTDEPHKDPEPDDVCDECGDDSSGLMHNNTWRSVEPLMDEDGEPYDDSEDSTEDLLDPEGSGYVAEAPWDHPDTDDAPPSIQPTDSPDYDEAAQQEAERSPSLSVNTVWTVNCATCGFSEAFGNEDDADDTVADHACEPVAYDTTTTPEQKAQDALAVSGEPLPAVLNALAADLEEAVVAGRDGKGDYLGTMEDVAETLADLATKTENALAVLRKIEAGRPCLDFDTTSDDLAEWARNVVVPALEEAGLL